MSKLGFPAIMAGFSVVISSRLFFLVWNTVGTAIFSLAPVGLTEVLAVNLLCAPMELFIIDSVVSAMF